MSTYKAVFSDIDGTLLTSVSYTHLDVYKRQVYKVNKNRYK